MLLEWTTALELHQRGRVKAVLPLLVGETDFFAEAQTAFGGVQGLPVHRSKATLDRVTTHLGETTGDDSTAGLRKLLQQVSGSSQETTQGIVSCLLKFQGVKVSQSGAATTHSHGHMSVGADDLHACTSRIRETVSSCLKRVGANSK